MLARTRHTLAATACALLALGTATACSGDPEGSHNVIGLAIADETSEFFIAAADGVRDYAEQHGYKVLTQSADDDSTKQVNQVENLLTRYVDALIYVPAGAAAAEVPVRRANTDHVPVITIDRQPSPKSKLVSFIATDSVAAGKQICSLLIDRIHGRGQIGIIQGQIGTTPQEARQKGCSAALRAHPQVKVVAQQSANWNQSEGYNVAQNMLSGHPKMVGIFAQSDAMALGAAKAAHDANRRLPIVGIDGFPDMFGAIKAGSTTATMAQQPYNMGRLAAKNAIAAIEHHAASIPRVQYQKAYLVTADNVAEMARRRFYGPLGA